MADLVTRMLLETQQFDNNLGKSSKQIQNFQNKMQNAGKGISSGFTSVIGVVGKFAGVFGVAMGSIEGFNKLIEGSRDTSDAFAKKIEQGRSSINLFFNSLNTGDLSGFLSNLDVAIDRAGKLSEALNYLNEVNLFGGVTIDNLETEKQLLLDISKDRTKSDKERLSALNKAKEIEKDIIQLTNKQVLANKNVAEEKLKTAFAERGYGKEISIEEIKKITDYRNRDVVDNYAGEYKRRKEESLKGRDVVTRQSTTGAYNLIIETDEFTKNQKQFSDWLSTEDGKWSELMYTYTQLDDSEKGLVDGWRNASLEANRLIKETSRRQLELKSAETSIKGNSSKTNKSNVPAVEGSLAYLDEEIKKLREKLSKETDAGVRLGYNNAIRDLEKKKILLDIEYNLQTSKLDNQFNTQTKGKLASKEKESKLSGNIGKTSYNYDEYKQAKTDSKLFEVDTNALDYITTIGGVMSSLSGTADEAGASWLNYSANIIAGIAAMLPSLSSLFGFNQMIGISEQAKIPFPLNIIAMAATGAALASTIASLPKFADGGVIGGNSFIGDMQLARVNSGEMIMNNRQQRNLFNLLNGNTPATSNSSGVVELKVRGRDLVGVLNNQTNKTSKYV